MIIEIKNKLTKKTLTLTSLKLPTLKLSSKLDHSSTSRDQVQIDTNSPQEITVNIIQPAPPSFPAIYKELHNKFPETINLKKPVLLAVGIRKQMSQATGISSVILKKWTAWYFRKSNYYAEHNEGSVRYNLDGSEAGTVTEKHHEKMSKFFEKLKQNKPEANNKSKNLTDELSCK